MGRGGKREKRGGSHVLWVWMQLGKAKSITLVTWSVGHRERQTDRVREREHGPCHYGQCPDMLHLQLDV